MWTRIALVLAVANVAYADDELQRCGLGAYLEPSAMVGASSRLVAPGDRETSLSWLVQVGGGISERICSADRRSATRIQLGLDLAASRAGTTSYQAAGAFGFEAAADHTLAPNWRLGGATSVGWGNQSIVYTLGARLHYRDWGWAGVELVRVQTQYVYDPCANPTTTVQGCQSSATGLYAGFGAEHRYVGYATGGVLVVGGIVVAIIAAGLGAVH